MAGPEPAASLSADNGQGDAQGDAEQPPMFVCLDVSGSIRNTDAMYTPWVLLDVAELELAPRTTWILWGSDGVYRDSREDVIAYLKADENLGGTQPLRFIELLPASGLIDLHVYTDGEIGEYDVTEARKRLDEHHPGLKFRRVVINYANSNLDYMNVGLSAIFESYVTEMYRTRVADGKKVHQFEATPLESTVTVRDILDQYYTLANTEGDMTKGMMYLSQRFANANPKLRQEIRRLVRERADAINKEHRTICLTGAQEDELVSALEARQWKVARKPFIGHDVAPGVKLLQAYCQKFLNETRDGRALIRISAYAPLTLRGKAGDAASAFDEHEEVLIDHIMYLGLGKEAIVVLPASFSLPEVPRVPGERRARKLQSLNHVKCGLKCNVKVNFDNTFGLNTLFQLRTQQRQDGVGDATWAQVAVLDQLSARAHGEPAPEAEALSSSAPGFGVNPFTRQQMECVLLIPASAESLPADRLAEVDAWNAHMLSRFARQGRSMPSAPLLMALLLERAFASWAGLKRAEDRAEAEKLKAVCRQYIGHMQTPLTFSVGLPVVVQGSFRTAARLACGVLQAALDPSLPMDVLTQFWFTITETADAAQVWACLRPYAGLPDDAPFPADHFRTLRALVSGVQLSKSGRDAKLRAKKGLGYSVRMFTKRLDQLDKDGCAHQRLRDEEKAVREDLFGVPASEPLLCVHGVDADECKPLPDQDADVLCESTCRPTLLNKKTMDMWYVGQPQDQFTRRQDSFHKAMWQLIRKRTKGKRPRHDKFPPDEHVFQDFVNHRLRAMHLDGGDKENKDYASARLLPTVPCPRLAQDISLVYESYLALAKQVPNMTRKKFMKALRAPREVCAFGPCCQYIRDAVSDEQLAWIDGHATHLQVVEEDVLSGQVSYRQVQ